MVNPNREAKDKVTALNNSKQDANSTLNKVIQVYENLGTHSVDSLYDLYTEDVYFEDPAHAIQGLKALTSYFEKLFNNVRHCQFRFHNSLSQEDKLFLCWTMTLQHKQLKKGQKIFVEGASLLKVRDGRVYYHRDYFDLGNMLYENIPVVGGLVKQIKKGLVR